MIEGVENYACEEKIEKSEVSFRVCRYYVNHSPVRKIGIEMKKPPTAQVRLVLDFSK